jgi:oligopeptide transport system substrate-binding protein
MKIDSLLQAVAAAGALALYMGSAAGAATLQMYNAGDPRTLDPQKASHDWEDRPISDYLEGLMTLDAGGRPILGQAASYDVSEDALVYTFTLRDDAVWSDGTRVTAKDFVLGMQRLEDPAIAAENAHLMYSVKNAKGINSGELVDLSDWAEAPAILVERPLSDLGVKALDDKTVEITLDAPTPYLLAALAHYSSYPVPSHVVEAKGEAWSEIGNLVANGPFIPVEWMPGSLIRSVKNEAYYDADNVKLDEVVYHLPDDDGAALSRYRAGELDMLSSFPADQYQQLQDQNPGEAHVAPLLGVYYYAMNQTDPALADINVRKALSISLNREALGTGEPPAYGLVPPGTGNYEGEQYLPDWSGEPYDQRVEEARQLMAGAGFTPDKPLHLQIRVPADENDGRVARAVASMWEPIGVEAELVEAEEETHYRALQVADFQIGRAVWLMDQDDAGEMLDRLKFGNYGRYSNSEYEGLLAKAAAELDPAARAGLLHRAEAIAMDEFGVLPIYYYASRWVVSPKVGGFEDNAVNRHLARWLSKSE